MTAKKHRAKSAPAPDPFAEFAQDLLPDFSTDSLNNLSGQNGHDSSPNRTPDAERDQQLDEFLLLSRLYSHAICQQSFPLVLTCTNLDQLANLARKLLDFDAHDKEVIARYQPQIVGREAVSHSIAEFRVIADESIIASTGHDVLMKLCDRFNRVLNGYRIVTLGNRSVDDWSPGELRQAMVLLAQPENWNSLEAERLAARLSRERILLSMQRDAEAPDGWVTVRARDAEQQYGIPDTTLRRWAMDPKNPDAERLRRGVYRVKLTAIAHYRPKKK